MINKLPEGTGKTYMAADVNMMMRAARISVFDTIAEWANKKCTQNNQHGMMPASEVIDFITSLRKKEE